MSIPKEFFGRYVLSQIGSTGELWESKIVYCFYWASSGDREIEEPHVSTKYSEIPRAIKDIGINTNLLEQRVYEINAFSIELAQNFSTLTKHLLAHHFLEVRTHGGFAITFEKNKSNILIQSCRKWMDNPVRRKRDGVQRLKLETMIKIGSTTELREITTIRDIFEMIETSDQLERPYHVIDSNCQEFVKFLWKKLSTSPFSLIEEYKDEKPLYGLLPGERSFSS